MNALSETVLSLPTSPLKMRPRFIGTSYPSQMPLPSNNLVLSAIRSFFRQEILRSGPPAIVHVDEVFVCGWSSPMVHMRASVTAELDSEFLQSRCFFKKIRGAVESAMKDYRTSARRSTCSDTWRRTSNLRPGLNPDDALQRVRSVASEQLDCLEWCVAQYLHSRQQ